MHAPVDKLSCRLAKFREALRAGEENLNLKVDKFNLDKYILLKEKMNCIWKEELFERPGPASIKATVRKIQALRSKVYEHQKQAYTNVLNFIKVRGYTPVAEEKMLLDGIKIVLDNGWTVREEEMLELFDLCGLKQKIFISGEHRKFLEFIFVVTENFALDQPTIQQYFEVK